MGDWGEVVVVEVGVSLSEALLDGHVGEEGRELLDDPGVYLGAEGDVEEEKLWTRLQKFLQGSSANHSRTCPSVKSQVGKKLC